MSRSHSSVRGLSAGERARDWYGHFRRYVSERGEESDFSETRRNIAEYRHWVKQVAGVELEDARAIEVGYGPRPERLFWLSALGVDVVGVDLDQPVLSGRPAELMAVFRTNGVERCLKSTVRHFLFDRGRRNALAEAIEAETGRPFRLPRERLFVGDAGGDAFWSLHAEPVHLIYSEDVFEHIPRPALVQVVAQMAAHLRDDGVALVRPMVFTGIAGGHLLEWYPEFVDRDEERRSEPWEHLRRNRFPANSYLNELTLDDYRELLSTHFDILEERVTQPAMGRQYLTPEVREELRAYSEADLLSNNVLFVLRKRS